YYLYAALALFTATSVMDKHILTGHKLPPTAFLAFQHLFFAAIFSAWILFARSEWRAEFGALSRETRLLVLLVSVLTIGYRFAQIEALTLAPAALVLSVKRLSVLMATAAGGRLFREERRGRKIVAVVALLAGATIVLVY
ncbi:MAG: EamA family transporter, partial [Ignavibacteriales bacterium]|nr:EamA family transporter [Ignavibacteriales bacterium]